MPFVVLAGRSDDGPVLKLENCVNSQHVSFAVSRFRAMGLNTITIIDGEMVCKPEDTLQSPMGEGSMGAGFPTAPEARLFILK